MVKGSIMKNIKEAFVKGVLVCAAVVFASQVLAGTGEVPVALKLGEPGERASYKADGKPGEQYTFITEGVIDKSIGSKVFKLNEVGVAETPYKLRLSAIAECTSSGRKADISNSGGYLQCGLGEGIKVEVYMVTEKKENSRDYIGKMIIDGGNDGHKNKLIKQSTLNSQLMQAVLANDLEQAKKLVAEGANIRFRDASGQTLLHNAAAFGALNIMRWLVKEEDIEVEICDDYSNRPAHVAASHGEIAAVVWLARQGANLLETNDGKQSVLEVLRQNGYGEDATKIYSYLHDYKKFPPLEEEEKEQMIANNTTGGRGAATISSAPVCHEEMVGPQNAVNRAIVGPLAFDKLF